GEKPAANLTSFRIPEDNVRSLLRRLASLFASKPAARPATPRHLRVESLEGREVPAVVGLTPLTPVLHTNGVLTVIGNDAANTIDVTKSGAYVKVQGRLFASAQVKTIVIDGQGGNDVIRVSDQLFQKTFLYGGQGNDTIYGGGGVDTIF